jgi:hypothetical protein
MTMLLYEAMLCLEDLSHAAALEAYMRGRHIPNIFATGCFRDIRFCRIEDGRFRTTYAAATQDDFDRYLRDYAPALRDDFAAHAPPELTVAREVWTVMESWG